MKSFLIIVLASFLGFLFNKTSFNFNSYSLKKSFLDKNSNYLDTYLKVKENRHFNKYQDLLRVNLVSHNNIITEKQDSLFLEAQDSLVSTAYTKNRKLEARLKTASVYFSFRKRFNTLLIQKIEDPNQEDLLVIDEYIITLKEALRKDSYNNTARHNLEVLIKFKQRADYYYNKAHDLSELIYEQLESELKSDSAFFRKFITQGYATRFKKDIEAIKTADKQALCLQEIDDSLKLIATPDFLNGFHKETVDSIKTYDNIDTDLIKKLKSNKTTPDIINEFYDKEFPNLYSATSKESFIKITQDRETGDTVEKIILKYLDPEQQDEKQEEKEDEKQEKEENQDNKEEKEEDQQQDENDQKETEKNKKEQQNKEEDTQDKQNSNDKKEGDQQKNQGKSKDDSGKKEDSSNEKQGDSSDPKNDLEKEQQQKSENRDYEDKKQEMKNELGDRQDKKKEEVKYNQEDNEEQNEIDGDKEAQKNESQSQEQNTQQELDNNNGFSKHNMTKENAEQTLKAIEQKADRYLQNQKRAQRRDLEYGRSKPDW